MSKQDRQKLSILIVLLVVLGLTVVLGYRMNQPETTNAVQAPAPKTSEKPPTAIDAKLRLDLVEKETGQEDAGRKNPFEYHQTPPPAPPPTQRGLIPAANTGPPELGLPSAQFRPGQVAPPGPPPIPLKYQGYAVSTAPGGPFTAFIADDSRHYNVTVGEVLMGRYRILGISDKTVDVEDLELNRRQSLPIVK
jgi:hypothetical protein